MAVYTVQFIPSSSPGIQPFSFSFQSATYINPPADTSTITSIPITPFTFTDGTNSWTMASGAVEYSSIASQLALCFKFSTVGMTQAYTQNCDGDVYNNSSAGQMLTSSLFPLLFPTSPGTYSLSASVGGLSVSGMSGSSGNVSLTVASSGMTAPEPNTVVPVILVVVYCTAKAARTRAGRC